MFHVSCFITPILFNDFFYIIFISEIQISCNQTREKSSVGFELKTLNKGKFIFDFFAQEKE